MLAVFAEAPPKGMKPLLKEDKKDKEAKKTAKKTPVHPRHAARKAAPPRGRAVAADVSVEEQLAMTGSRVVPGLSHELPGGHMAVLVSVCCAGLVAALVVMTRRRRAGEGGNSGYGPV